MPPVFTGIPPDHAIYTKFVYIVYNARAFVRLVLGMQNPFCPGGVVDPVYFCGRQAEIALFKRSLQGAKCGRPQHLAVLGARGIGKTSMMRYLAHIAARERCLVIRVELDPAVGSLDELCQVLLRELARGGLAYSLLERTASKLRGIFSEYHVTVSAAGVVASAGKNSEAASRYDFRDRLLALWQRTKNRIPAIVILIDEAEQLEKIPGALQFLRNTFSRLSEEKCGYLLVLCWKLNLYSNISELYSPLARFFKPLALSSLSSEDSVQVVKKPLEAARRRISKVALDRCYADSLGHPYMLQAIGFELFESGTEISEKIYEAIRPLVLRDLETKLFSEMFNAASPQEKEILLVLSERGKPESTTTVANAISKPRSSVSTLLSRLTDSGCVIRLERGTYVPFHPLFSEFIRKNKAK